MENKPALLPFLQQAWDRTGFTHWTAVQEEAIPLIREGRDLIAESPTGTGKTLAYVLPLMERIESENKNPQVLILAPTRELVIQIGQVMQDFAVDTEITSLSLIGGADMKRQIERLRQRPQMIVGTPGRVKELIDLKRLRMHDVKTIVIDEADQTLQPHFRPIVEEVIKKTLRDRQMLFFSATIPNAVEKIGQKLMNDPQVIRITQSQLPKSQVEHMYVVADRRDKIDTLRRLVRMEPGKYMAFVNDSIQLDEIAQKLAYKGIETGVLQGSNWKTERETVMNRFREGRVSLLLTTDLAARGLDIDDVTHVVHYDLPEEDGAYIHRSGRTGRMGKEGKVLSIVSPREQKRMAQLAKVSDMPIAQKEMYKGELIDQRERPANQKQRGNKK